VRLVVKKIGSGWEWVVERSEEERNRSQAGGGGEESRPGTEFQGIAGNAQDKKGGPGSGTIPFLCAMADPEEKWWERVRGNPKRSGEISQAAFLLKASTMGFNLALPWGDSERAGPATSDAGASEGDGEVVSGRIRSAAGTFDAARREETVYEERNRCDRGARATGGCLVPDPDRSGG
jgi:hypothetical protein